jgi:hypothetical protein
MPIAAKSAYLPGMPALSAEYFAAKSGRISQGQPTAQSRRSSAGHAPCRLSIFAKCPIELVPGCRMRTPFGEHLMLVPGNGRRAEVPWHSHPHEQGGILIRGRVQLSIGDETHLRSRLMFIIRRT